MKLFESLIWIVVAFLACCLDTSFFAFYEIFNATIISSFCLILVITLLDYKIQSLYYGAFCILFLSALSSLPIYSLFVAYMIIPLLIFYLRQKIYFEAVLPVAVFVLLISSVIFRLSIIPLGSFSYEELLLSVLAFPILNTIFGAVIFVLFNKYHTSRRGHN
jgi:hypothetical protein